MNPRLRPCPLPALGAGFSEVRAHRRREVLCAIPRSSCWRSWEGHLGLCCETTPPI